MLSMRCKVSILLVLLAVAVLAFPSRSARAQDSTGADSKITPVQLYHKVWQMIHDQYFDPTYNNQSWTRWEHRYDRQLKSMDDSHKAIETMLASLADRYTRFLDRSAFDDEKMQIAAKLCGIGIQMGMDKTQKIIVIAPIDGSPAAKAGLMALDEIDAIDGKPTKGISVEEASKHIRGPIDSDVVLTIIRNGQKMDFKITRAEIPIRCVQMVKMLNKDVGYMRLTTFMSENASQEIRDALDKLTPARGIILDLRDNPGGLVTNAIAICSMFLDGGNVVSTVDRNGHMVPSMSTGHPISHQPLVVLINGGSASASEITSGALHDYGRAQLVGTKSFGKGLVQGVNRLDDGSGVNITIARYLTPHNIDIHKKGIVPDYDVELKIDDYRQARGPWWLDPGGPLVKRSPDDGKDIQLNKALVVMEDKINNAQPAYQLKMDFPAIVSPDPLSSPTAGLYSH